MPHAAFAAALLAGLFGGLHCAAMCGGWVAAAAVPRGQGVAPLLARRTLVLRTLLNHAGRIGTYVALGALAGASGGVASTLAFPLARPLAFAAANAVLILLALPLLGTGARVFAPVERAGLALFRAFSPPALRAARHGAVTAPLAMGALWGLTPCALVYGVLPVALFSGSAISGGLIMLVFGAGTLPHLLAAQYALARFGTSARLRRLRPLAGALIIAFGVVGIGRVVFDPGALLDGPFCLVPSAEPGKLNSMTP